MYLLDSNVFIEAQRRYYSHDFVPGFWDWLVRSFENGVLASIDKIGEEIAAGDKHDPLTVWAKAHREIFLETDSSVEGSFRRLSRWAMGADLPYTQAARFAFMHSGDYRLIAYARAHGHTVATHEKSEPESKKDVKIPDACKALGVACIDPFTIIRETGARFVMEDGT